MERKMNIDLVDYKNPLESSFRTQFKSVIVLSALAGLSTLSLLVYFTAWIKMSTTYNYFMAATKTEDWIRLFYKYYMFAYEHMIWPFAVASAIMVASGIWGAISLYVYLSKENKPLIVPLVFFIASWFAFLMIPIFSYIPIILIWIGFYNYVLFLPIRPRDVKIETLKVSLPEKEEKTS